jgi:hypothetical protein
MSDTGLERANSHDSEHPRYSGHRFGQLNGMNGGPNAIYPSPTVMRNPLPAENGFDNSMAQQENNRRGHSVAGKAFQCSTCGKGFGKRGVLNRHGKVFS